MEQYEKQQLKQVRPLNFLQACAEQCQIEYQNIDVYQIAAFEHPTLGTLIISVRTDINCIILLKFNQQTKSLQKLDLNFQDCS